MYSLLNEELARERVRALLQEAAAARLGSVARAARPAPGAWRRAMGRGLIAFGTRLAAGEVTRVGEAAR